MNTKTDYTVNNIANFVVNYSNEKQEPITSIKLHNLLYKLFQEYYRTTGRFLFSEQFESCFICPWITKIQKDYGNIYSTEVLAGTPSYTLSTEDYKILSKSLSKYCKLDLDQLINSNTEPNSPWAATRNGETIQWDLITKWVDENSEIKVFIPEEDQEYILTSTETGLSVFIGSDYKIISKNQKAVTEDSRGLTNDYTKIEFLNGAIVSRLAFEEILNLDLQLRDYRVMILLATKVNPKTNIITHQNGIGVNNIWIAEKFKISERTVSRSLKKLQEYDIIKKQDKKIFFNPFILKIKKHIKNSTYEMFKETRWNKINN